MHLILGIHTPSIVCHPFHTDQHAFPPPHTDADVHPAQSLLALQAESQASYFKSELEKALSHAAELLEELRSLRTLAAQREGFAVRVKQLEEEVRGVHRYLEDVSVLDLYRTLTESYNMILQSCEPV